MSVCQVSAQTQHIVFSNPNHNNIIPACRGYIKDASVCCHACDWNHWIMFSPATTSRGDLDNIDGNSAPTYFINLNITFNHEICIKVRLEKTNLESAGLHHLCSLLGFTLQHSLQHVVTICRSTAGLTSTSQ